MTTDLLPSREELRQSAIDALIYWRIHEDYMSIEEAAEHHEIGIDIVQQVRTAMERVCRSCRNGCQQEHALGGHERTIDCCTHELERLLVLHDHRDEIGRLVVQFEQRMKTFFEIIDTMPPIQSVTTRCGYEIRPGWHFDTGTNKYHFGVFYVREGQDVPQAMFKDREVVIAADPRDSVEDIRQAWTRTALEMHDAARAYEDMHSRAQAIASLLPGECDITPMGSRATALHPTIEVFCRCSERGYSMACAINDNDCWMKVYARLSEGGRERILRLVAENKTISGNGTNLQGGFHLVIARLSYGTVYEIAKLVGEECHR